MAERGVHCLQRVLGTAVGIRLAEADVGQLALHRIDQAGIHLRRRRKDCRLALSAMVARLSCWVSRWRRMSCSAPSTWSRLLLLPLLGRGLDALQQIGHALFEMRERRSIVVGDRHAIDALGQRTDRALEVFVVVAGLGRTLLLAALDGRGQRGDALIEQGQRIAVAGRMRHLGELVDPRRQHLDVVGKPRQCVVGSHVGHDGAKCRNRAFELMHRRRIVIGAQDQVELGVQVADRLVIACELLGGFRREQHLADFAERALDAGKLLAVDAAAAVSSMRRDSERISFSIDSIARRGIASVMAWRISASSLRKTAIDCSM